MGMPNWRKRNGQPGVGDKIVASYPKFRLSVVITGAGKRARCIHGGSEARS